MVASTSLDGPVDVERVMQHVRALSVDIGIRAAGTDGERKAADYISGVLTSQGYTTTVEPFTFRMRFDESTLTVGGATVQASLFDGAASGTVSGALVDGGQGAPEQIPAAARGGVLLVRRGGISFAQKVANAQQAGALAVVVLNSESGRFRGTLGMQRSTIPAIAVDGAEADRLRGAQSAQSVTVTASGGMRSVTSQNVVGRKGATCRAYIGAHYDSVPEGPGANDNATGTGTMLELARVRGTDGLCAVAFGSEEAGLRGSEAFVAQHLAGGAKFMLNFDMTGRIQNAMIVGDEALTQSILGIVGRGADQPLRAGAFPPYASSDHVSFSSVGVPAVTITSGDDPNIHTPGDTFEAVRKPDLKVLLILGDTALTGLLKTLGAR